MILGASTHFLCHSVDVRMCSEEQKVKKGLEQGCQTQFLEGRSPAEFSFNPAPTHIPCILAKTVD